MNPMFSPRNLHDTAAGRTRRDRVLFSMLSGNIAYAAGQHNRLVVVQMITREIGEHGGMEAHSIYPALVECV